MWRAARAASVSVAAPVTVRNTVLVEPSASSAIWTAKSRQAADRARPRTDGSMGPARPLARRSTVSLVDSAPSTVRQLNEVATAPCSSPVAVVGSTAASVVSTASMVAMLGSSMAAPLAIPPTVNPSPSTWVFLGTVSVVMMASAAAWPPAGFRESATRPIPVVMASMGSG